MVIIPVRVPNYCSFCHTLFSYALHIYAYAHSLSLPHSLTLHRSSLLCSSSSSSSPSVLFLFGPFLALLPLRVRLLLLQCLFVTKMAVPSGYSSSVPTLPPPRPRSPPEYPDLYGKRRETAKVQMLEREIGFLEEELKSMQGLQPASRCCKEVTDFVVANADPIIPTNRKKRRPWCGFWKWLCGSSCCNFSWICCSCCCCCTKCSCDLEMPRCSNCCKCIGNPCKCPSCTCSCPSCSCSCPTCSCPSCFSCSAPKCPPCSCSCACPCPCPCPCPCACPCPSSCACPCPSSCACPRLNCFKKSSCKGSCCSCRLPSCPDCSCCCSWSWKCCCWPKCPTKCPKIGNCCSCNKKCCCNPCSYCLCF